MKTPMSFRLYLVRHGATLWNESGRAQGRLPGIGLSPTGIAQVQAQAATLRFKGFAAVVSSPLQRALETADILLEGAGIDASVALDESFSEWDIPPWNGLTVPEIEARFPVEFRQLADTPVKLSVPGAETLHGVQARGLKGVQRLRETYPDQAVLVVTHAAIVAAITCGLLAIPLTSYQQLPISNASLTLIEIAGQPVLQLFNWHPSKLE
jgi:broad specificity phosphatase PhoE